MRFLKKSAPKNSSALFKKSAPKNSSALFKKSAPKTYKNITLCAQFHLDTVDI